MARMITGEHVRLANYIVQSKEQLFIVFKKQTDQLLTDQLLTYIIRCVWSFILCVTHVALHTNIIFSVLCVQEKATSMTAVQAVQQLSNTKINASTFFPEIEETLLNNTHLERSKVKSKLNSVY